MGRHLGALYCAAFVTTDVHEGDAVAPAAPLAGRDRAPRQGRALAALLVAAVDLPIVVATARALARGWQPIGDDGILAVRVRDVGTVHNPLLGSWTSASVVVGKDFNNPGPAYFDLVAPWVKVLGPWVGVAVGVMVLNVVACTAAVLLARRLCGTQSMVAVAVALAGLQFVMGSELLFALWQPHALMLPFVLLLVVLAVLARGEPGMVPWAVGVGTVLVQTHVSYAPLVGGLGLGAGVAGVLAVRRRGGPVAWRRPVVLAAGLAVLLWVQPLVEQVTGRGEGNLSRILGAAGSGDAPAIGWSRGLQLVAEITVGAPWFSRSGFDRAVPPTAPEAALGGVMGTAAALATVAALVAVLVVVAVAAGRRGRPDLATFAGAAAVAVVVGDVALSTSPVNVIGIAVHQMRWLWPLAAFVTAALLTAVLVGLRGRAARVALGGAVAATFVVAVATLPTHRSMASGPSSLSASQEAAVDLVGQLGSLEGRGPVLWDSELVFAEPFSGLVFAELQDRGIPFLVGDEVDVRQLGEGRRDDGSARLRLWEVVGPGARVVPDGAERVAYVEDSPWGPVALFVEPLDAA